MFLVLYKEDRKVVVSKKDELTISRLLKKGFKTEEQLKEEKSKEEAKPKKRGRKPKSESKDEE